MSELWIAEAIATDGLHSPRKAVKIQVFREERPGINYLTHLKAQTIGQYRVQYQEWAEGGNVLVRWRSVEPFPARHPLMDGLWHTMGEASEADQEAQRA